MIVKCAIAILICIVVTDLAYAHLGEENEIGWEERPKLVWSDFQVIEKTQECGEDLGYTPVACVRTHIHFTEYNFTKVNSNICQFQITRINAIGVFDKINSWVVNGEETDSLLNHEQGHFHISQINSRLLEGETLFSIFECPDGIYDENKIESFILNKAKNHKQDVVGDKEYDIQTEGGGNESEQRFWDGKIKTLFQIWDEPSLDDYITIAPVPLKQIKDGIDPLDVQCKAGWKRVVKNSDTSACVTPAVAKILEERNWGNVVGILRYEP